MMWGWFLPASLLGLLMILIIRSLRDIGQWWGIPLLLGGLWSLVVIAIVSTGRIDLVRDALTDFAPAGTLYYRAIEIALLGILVAAIRLAFFHALLISGAGLALWVITRQLSRREKSSVELEPDPDDESSMDQVSGIPAPPPVPPLGSGPDDKEGPPSGIFG
jgi:chromate transport protein ChrA